MGKKEKNLKLHGLKHDQIFGNKEMDDLQSWKEEWKDMPEFVQEDLTPLKSIIVHFITSEDMKEFSKLMNQKITSKTKSI